jgi:hypothetical protein
MMRRGFFRVLAGAAAAPAVAKAAPRDVCEHGVWDGHRCMR